MDFTDAASYRANNCVGTNRTNGIDLYGGKVGIQTYQQAPPPIAYFQQQPSVDYEDIRKQPINVILDGLHSQILIFQNIYNPTCLRYSVAQFYILNDDITGVLALGSFSAKNFTAFGMSLLAGLQELKTAGAERLIVDVVGTLLKPIFLQLISSLFTVEQRRR